MIKYKLHNVRKGRASTALVSGKRISLKSDEEKVITFTDFKKYEKSLNALKSSGIITVEKLTGKKAEEAEISSTVAPVVTEPSAEEIEAKKKLEEEAEAQRLKDEVVEVPADQVDALVKAPEGSEDQADATPESTEGSDDENKVPDSDSNDSNPDSDATVSAGQAQNAPAQSPAPQQNQGGNNKNRNRNRNRR